MKILIRVPNWIGDTVLALPAVASVKHSLPEAEVWIAAKDWVNDLFTLDNLADGMIPLQESGRLPNLSRTAREIRSHGFDSSLLLTNSFASALLFYLSKIPQRWGYATDGRSLLLTKPVRRRENDTARHQVYYYLDLITGLGLETVPPQLSLPLSEADKDAARRRLLDSGINLRRPLVVLSPGATYGPAKRWPADRFARAAALLQEKRDAEILVIGSARETEIAAAVQAAMAQKPTILTGQTSLRELLAVISQATLFLSNDTGPMHLANALGVPVVGVFGPTDPDMTGPFQPPARVVKKDDIPCWPCYYRKCPYDHRCLLTITPEEVVRVAESLWP
jgi:heptosyltransferase-2